MYAVTRALSPKITAGERTYIDRTPIDFARAVEEHAAYEKWLREHGCEIVHVDPAPDFADGVFVEDAAVVLDEVAVITRPGAKSRRGETESVAAVLQQYRPIERISAPGTVDGGDILRIDRTLYAGRMQRTNEEGIAQLRAIVRKYRYDVIAVDFDECLHLKTAVTQIAPDTLLVNPAWVDPSIFGLEFVAVDPREAFAANALLIGDRVLLSADFPRTRRILEHRGLHVDTVPTTELLKAEAGVTCCSLIFE